METLFFISALLVFYTYIGYGAVIYFLTKLKKNWKPQNEGYEPEITLVVPAYNEKDYVKDKIENSLQINYPKDKLKLVWVTDGSNDGTPAEVEKFESVQLYHEDARNGKIAAINRVMDFIHTPIVIFSDANTFLPPNAIREMINLFADESVGCVAGEKRVMQSDNGMAGSGEGLYWKYESKLKELDFKLHSAVGAAGELFGVRTELFEKVESNVILDDFIISLRIAQKGYKIGYNPNAYALEAPSASIADEMKRKVRISAGGLQSVVMLSSLLNIFKYGMLSFQYISHRVLRWTVTPIALLLLFVSNIFLINNGWLYQTSFSLQAIFYMCAVAGYVLRDTMNRRKIITIPFYFVFMNWSVFLGAVRFFKRKQSAAWEKSNRSNILVQIAK